MFSKPNDHSATIERLHLLHHLQSYWKKQSPICSLLISSPGKPLRANVFVLEIPTWSNDGLHSCNKATTDNGTHGFTHVNGLCLSVCLFTSAKCCGASHVEWTLYEWTNRATACDSRGLGGGSRGFCVFVCCDNARLWILGVLYLS